MNETIRMLEEWHKAEWSEIPPKTNFIKKLVKMMPELPEGACGDVRENVIRATIDKWNEQRYFIKIEIEIGRLDCTLSNQASSLEDSKNMVTNYVTKILGLSMVSKPNSDQ